VVARPPHVITRRAALATRQVRVATASSHTQVLPVPGRTRLYTHTTRPRRPADDICTGVCPVTGMLARRLTLILPTMTLAEALETRRIHRVAGRTGDRTALVTTCPSRAPHHTISDVGLIGACLVQNVTWLSQQQACPLVPVYGQAGDIFYKQKRGPARLPGEVSRALHGMLFLNESPECRAHGLGSCARPPKNVSSTAPLAGIADLVTLALTAAQVVTPAELLPSTVVSHTDAHGYGGRASSSACGPAAYGMP
jgi:hypothetical protein